MGAAGDDDRRPKIMGTQFRVLTSSPTADATTVTPPAAATIAVAVTTAIITTTASSLAYKNAPPLTWRNGAVGDLEMSGPYRTP